MILYEQEVTNDAGGNHSAITTNVATLAALMGEGDDDDPTSNNAMKADRYHKSPESSQSSSTWDESSDDDDCDSRIMIGESWPNTTEDEGTTSTSTIHDTFNAIIQQVESSPEAVTNNRSDRRDNASSPQSKNSSSDVQQPNISALLHSSLDFPSLRTSPFADPLMNNGSQQSNPCKKSCRSLCNDHELDETVTISSSSSLAMSSLWYRMCTAEARPRLHMFNNRQSTKIMAAASVGTNDVCDVEVATNLDLNANDGVQGVTMIKGQQQQQLLVDFKLFWASLVVETA
mmetsp:Transcript_20789/g.33787  ORF Transcript_20789/g.33787 Transcript_20789/m.33787 type:complete len:288 (+) Transcript_20789:210-1073(+)